MLSFPLYGTLNKNKKTIIRHPEKFENFEVGKWKNDAPGQVEFDLMEKQFKGINYAAEKLKRFKKEGFKQAKLRKSMDKIPVKRKLELPNGQAKKMKLAQKSMSVFLQA